MKLLIISNYSHVIPTRPEAEALIGLSKKGVEITVMTFKDAAYTPRFRQEGIRVIDFHPLKKLDTKEIKFIRQELIDGDYDILQLFNSKATVSGIRAARGLKVKVVLYRGYTGNIYWYDPTLYFKYFHPRVDGIWCIAQSTAELINRNTIFGRKKAVSITKGHDPAWYADIKGINLSEFGIPKDAFVAAITANTRPMKGIPYLIKSTYHIPTNIPFYLLLIGNGLDTPEVKELAKKSPHADRIIFTGFRKDGFNIIKSVDVFVLSSLYGEAITKSVIEAMSLGVAPVITDISGNKELVVDGQCGLVVPKAQPEAMARAIVRLYENPEERKLFALEAKKHIEKNFHIEQTVERLYSWYQRLITN